jgi:hypothetical protein
VGQATSTRIECLQLQWSGPSNSPLGEPPLVRVPQGVGSGAPCLLGPGQEGQMQLPHSDLIETREEVLAPNLAGCYCSPNLESLKNA